MFVKKSIFFTLLFLSGTLTPTLFATRKNPKKHDAPMASDTSEISSKKSEPNYFALGEQHYLGQGVARDYVKAHDYFELAEARQDLEPEEYAQMHLYLGELYFIGCPGIATDNVKAQHHFERAEAQTVSPEAQIHARLHLGEIHYCAQQYTKARRYFELTKDQTVDPDAQAFALFYLGKIYYFGQGVQEHHTKAFSYFKQATEQTVQKYVHANASRYLGKLYYLGEGTATNYPKARQLLEQETTQKIEPKIQAFSWHLLGGIYYWGQGIAINHIKARNYFTLAANQIAATDIQAFSRRYLREMNRLGEGVILTDTESPTDTNAEKAPECVICLEEANEQRGALSGLPCYNNHGQIIHQECLDTLMSQQTPHCPLCRVKLVNPQIKK